MKTSKHKLLCGLGLYAALPKKQKPAGRRLTLFLVGLFLVGFAIFMGLKAINTLKKKQEEAATPAGPTKDQELLTEIRDLLKSQQGK